MEFERNHMKYEDYKLEHFLCDEFFVQWVKNPDENTKHFWEKWLVANPHKREIVIEAAQFIKSITYQERPELSNEAYLELFENIIRFEESEVSTNKKATREGRWFSFFSLRKVAAVLLCCFCTWVIWDIFNSSGDEAKTEIQWITKSIPKGTKSSIGLSDGTIIHLNSGSELIYPNEFSDSLRVVTLKGEAFFEVNKESRPFKVQMDQAVIEVLGTEFNVNQSSNNQFAVALVSGKVKVNDNLGNQVVLDPSEMLVMEKDGNFYKSTFDSLEIVGWKDKNLIFNEDDFSEVKSKLENWYGIEISVRGKVSKKWAYTGQYHDEILKNVLEGIKQTSRIQYHIDGKKVEITL